MSMDFFTEWDRVDASHTAQEICAAVTGRKIKFDQSVFPSSIEIDGKEILFAPITLTAEFGQLKGEMKKHKVILLEKTEEKVTYAIAQTAENLIVNASVTIEFDGFIRVDLRLIPFWSFDKDNVPRLTKLYMDIPIKNEFSTLMHFWPNCESGVCLSGRVLNSYATPDGSTSLPFKPYFWTGWEYGGLGLCCESDQGFEIKDPEQWISVNRGTEFTNVHIALLDDTPKSWRGRADHWGNNINPIMYSFAFQPTPVKRFDHKNLQNWRAFHLCYVPKSPIFEKVTGKGDTMLEQIAAKGTKWLILHEDWTVLQNYGLPEKEEEFKRFVKDCHDLGMKLMVYFGYEISSLYPGFNEVGHNYVNKNTDGNFVGGWQREPMQRDYTVCYHSDYSHIMLERVRHVMEEYGVDGIYTDGTYVPWECANEAHGCGYRDDDGNLRFAYPIYAVREHVKKLYQLVHERGGRVDTHQSSCCMMATLAFADSYYDGENIQGMIKEDIENLKLDSFRAEFMGRNMGIPCNFISYTEQGFTMPIIAGITLLHNVYPRARTLEDLEFTSHIWQIYDEFGTADAEWHPYWEQNEIQSDHADTYISYYKKDGDRLLLLTCYDKQAKKVTLKLDWEYAKLCDLLDPESGASVCLDRAEIPVTYAQVKIIAFKGRA